MDVHSLVVFVAQRSCFGLELLERCELLHLLHLLLLLLFGWESSDWSDSRSLDGGR